MTFLQSHLSSWIHAISSSSHLSPQLNKAVYAAGIETLFSLDMLRASPSSESLFTALSSLPDSPTTVNLAIPLLPRLFSTHTHSLRRYRTSLFPASQNNIQNRENDMRMTSMAFFASCLKLLAGNDLSWNARVGLVSIIESERIYASQCVGEMEVEAIREDAVRVLEEEKAEQKVVGLALDVLAALATVDYDVIEPVVGRILPRLILVSFTSSFVFFCEINASAIPGVFSSRLAHLPPYKNQRTYFLTSSSTFTPRRARYTHTLMHSLMPAPLFLPSDPLRHHKNSTTADAPLLS